MRKLENYVLGKWISGDGEGKTLYNAVYGDPIASTSTSGIPFEEVLNYGRTIGSPVLRKMTFHERARMLKALAMHLSSKKKDFYALSYATGATKADSWVDIEGGIGNLFVYASKGRRELPDEPYFIDGKPEMISKGGTFIGHHIAVPMQGVAIHINAFNFPVWGMLEKIAVNLLAGMPAVVKPATLTSYLTEAVVKEIIASKILPEGALQLLCGSAGNMLDFVNENDVVTFTGSADTGRMLKSSKAIIENSVRFNMEADSLNCSILAPDAEPGTAEFDLFVKEVSREITVKAGQKCTAIRRVIVPENLKEAVIEGVSKRLSGAIIGDPQKEGVRMGPLAGKEQVDDVTQKVNQLLESCELAYSYGNNQVYDLVGGSVEKGAFMPSKLLLCENPLSNSQVHEVEAFGPVSTIMGYKNIDDAIEISKRGRGSLVGSVFTGNNAYAKQIVLGCACMHGRMVVINESCAAESTGHGSPLPHLVHGGPGRAGGGEEMGGIRGVMHYLQRTAIQGSPTTLMHITNEYISGADRKEDVVHPFRKYFEELEIGDSITTHKRTITEGDIINFANLSWDHFYAHTDITSLDDTIFEQRVAHGYFVLSAAAGLFVDPGKGPVVANYGIDEVRFTKPVYAGTSMYVKLTVKQKTWKEMRDGDKVPTGEVKWHIEVFDQNDEMIAVGTILTLVKRKNH